MMIELLKKSKIIFSLIKFLYLFLMRFFNTLRYFFIRKNKKNAKREDVVVLGTGPSLKNDIEKIKYKKDKFSILVVNSFCLDANFEILMPKFYLLADPSYFVKNAAGVGLVDRDVFIENIKKKLCWDMNLILPSYAKNSYLVNELKSNSLIHFEYINLNEYKPYFVSEFKAFNKNVISPVVQNVLHMCIYYCIYKKFKTVYIFGADHNWCKDITVTTDNIVSIEENHFYEKEHHKSHPMEKEDGSYWNMGELFEAWTRVYNGYYKLRDYAEYNNIKIYNESSVSFIDAFQRKSGVFDDL